MLDISLKGLKKGVLLCNDVKRFNGKSIADCLCDCGNQKSIELYYFKKNNHSKCVCHLSEIRSRQGKKCAKHNDTSTRLYQIWENMRQRCNNPNAKGFKNYGGRGITICNEWNDYIVFKQWATTNGYADTLTIDRMDNNLNYCPTNCHWITNMAQQSNTTKNKFIVYLGIRATYSEWARITGLNKGVISYRLRVGKPLHEVFRTNMDWVYNVANGQ